MTSIESGAIFVGFGTTFVSSRVTFIGQGMASVGSGRPFVAFGMAFVDSGMPPSVIPGKRSATRNPFPMRRSSAKNRASDPRRHHATLLFGLKGFR